MRLQVTKTKYTPPELAELWGVSPDKIIRWILAGELHAINAATKKGRRPRYLIDAADIQAFEEARRVVPDEKPRPQVRRGTIPDYV